MKTLPIACATMLLAESALAQDTTAKPSDWIELRTKVIGCMNLDDAIEAQRLHSAGERFDAAKFVERQHALGDPKRECKTVDGRAGRDGRDWPVWDVVRESTKLTPGTIAICTSSPALKPSSGSCGYWVVVHARDVLKK